MTILLFYTTRILVHLIRCVLNKIHDKNDNILKYLSFNIIFKYIFEEKNF